MKHQWTLLLALLMCNPVTGSHDAQASELKLRLEQSCLRSAAKRGEPSEQTRRLCACQAEGSLTNETLKQQFPPELLAKGLELLAEDWDYELLHYDPNNSAGLTEEEAGALLGVGLVVWADCMKQLGLDEGIQWGNSSP